MKLFRKFLISLSIVLIGITACSQDDPFDGITDETVLPMLKRLPRTYGGMNVPAVDGRLLYDIIMNSQHFVDETVDGNIVKNWVFGKWAQYETLLHEQVHLWQQNLQGKQIEFLYAPTFS